MTVIDVDLHCVVPSVEALFPWIEGHWIEYINQSGFKGPNDTSYPRAPTSAIAGSVAPNGKPAGSSLDLLRSQALDPWKTMLGILNCSYAVDSIHNPDIDVALARAVNDWIIAEWLDKEPRLRASIVVPIKQPDAATREIERVGDHPGFVQVYLPVRTAIPYGKRMYHPVFEAATRHKLAIGLHYGGNPGNPPTSVGWPSYFIEEYTGMAQVYQSQLMNMIVEGVFDRFPDLRVACLESGFGWVPPVLWRFDKEWKGLRREIAWTKRLPSEYVREHIRFSLQPFDIPMTGPKLMHILDQIGSDDMLMFSTDYPHWHIDSPDQSLPAGLPAELVAKIMGGNAQSFYRLPTPVSAPTL